jgi:hypothetical protein
LFFFIEYISVDDCPQRFDPGLDPYKKPTIIYILNKANLDLNITNKNRINYLNHDGVAMATIV